MKLLAVSLYRPPQLTPQAIQIGRLLRHLNADVTLLCGRDWRMKDDFLQYPRFAEELHHVIVLPTPAPLLQGRWFTAAHLFLPFYATTPDEFRRWRWGANRAGIALQRNPATRCDVMATFASPFSCHLVGLKVKLATGIPWVAHFSDPWADNPYMVDSALVRATHRWLEGRVMAHADRVVFTCEQTLQLVMRKYPAAWRAKASTLPHSYDMRNLPAASPPVGGPLLVRHIGSLYGGRGPGPLFNALRQLAAESPDLARRMHVELVGPATPAHKALPDLAALPPGLVNFLPSVDYAQSIRLMRSAHVLLLIDAPADESVFLPSKLMDYIGADRTVLAITPPGASREVVLSVGGQVADPRQPEAIREMLRVALQRHEALDERLRAPTVQAEVQRYDAPNIARAFGDICRLALLARQPCVTRTAEAVMPEKAP